MYLFQKFFFTNLDAMFVDNSLRFIARDSRVDFLKLASSRDFETSSHAVKKLLNDYLHMYFPARSSFSFCDTES